NPYLTMSFDAEATIASELMKVAASGQLYRGSKPVMWSVVERTALAGAEIEYQAYESDAIWVKFPVARAIYAEAFWGRDTDTEVAAASEIIAQKQQMLRDAYVVIWTTTPWTIPGNRAVSFSSRITYGLYEVEAAAADNWARVGDKLILADKLAAEVMKSARVEGFERRGDVKPGAITALAHPVR